MVGLHRRALLACALAAACVREREPVTPGETVAAFVAALEASAGDPGARRRVYALLSSRAKAGLDARAARASQVSGRSFEAWEMLAPGRVRMLLQFDPGTIRTQVQGERAIVSVRGRSGGSADVPLVREEGRWRVDLELPPVLIPRGNDPRT